MSHRVCLGVRPPGHWLFTHSSFTFIFYLRFIHEMRYVPRCQQMSNLAGTGFSINVKKKSKRKWKMKDKNLPQVQPQCSVYICMKENFESWFFFVDMAVWMSNFDDFDNDQILRKLAQRWPFAFSFYSKIFFLLGNQDDSKNTKWNLIKNHPIPSSK